MNELPQKGEYLKLLWRYYQSHSLFVFFILHKRQWIVIASIIIVLILAIANRHSSPPYHEAKALLGLEEGVSCRKMINRCNSKPTVDRAPATVDRKQRR